MQRLQVQSDFASPGGPVTLKKCLAGQAACQCAVTPTWTYNSRSLCLRGAPAKIQNSIYHAGSASTGSRNMRLCSTLMPPSSRKTTRPAETRQ